MRLQAFTQNSKTILSVDFDRTNTCQQHCEYCYVNNMERIYKAYANKIVSNADWAKDNPDNFAKQLNKEYRQLRKSKAKDFLDLHKLPVRIYGSGDYIPEHYDFLEQLQFKHFVISKNLTMPGWEKHLDKLLTLPNLTRVVLSFDLQNIENDRKHLQELRKKDSRIAYAFTGMADDYTSQVGHTFDIFFNISRKQAELQKSKKIKASCPCDSGAIAHYHSCASCSKCWKSAVTRNTNFNDLDA